MPIFGKTVPPAWAEVLRTVQSVHPEAILAGGCLRDLILGGEVKDLDIFIQASNSNLREVLTFRHGWRAGSSINADYVATMRDEVSGVVAYRVPGVAHEVQIIALKDLSSPLLALERMDFGACQIGMIGPTHFVYTAAAAVDLTNRTITMLEPEDHIQECRTWARADRFEEKYRASDVRVIRNGPTQRLSESFAETFAA